MNEENDTNVIGYVAVFAAIGLVVATLCYISNPEPMFLGKE